MKTSLHFLYLLLAVVIPFYSIGQTNPSAVTLPFSLTSQPSATLPAGVAVHKFGTSAGSIPTTRTTANANSDLGHNTGGAAGNSGAWYSLGADGIGLLASSSNAAGAIVVSINTTNMESIEVSWKCKTILQQTSRDCSIALQYRIGTTGSFTDVGTTTTYTSAGKSAGDLSSTLTEILPVAAENQPEVQVRWIYWESSGTAGSRDKISVTDIHIDGTASVPVTLTRFTATKDERNNDVVLDWTTASEINNSHFEVERSADGTDFYAIGKVAGNGNHNGTIQYTFTDVNPSKNDVAYYRLKQVDFDGKSEYSRTVKISNAHADAFNATVYPNPVADNSALQYELTSATPTVTVAIYNSNAGLSYEHTEHNLAAGTYSIPVPSLEKGIYLARITAGSQYHTIRLIVQ